MPIEVTVLPKLIQAISDEIEKNADDITKLDQAIGDGDHVFNLRRGIQALTEQSEDLAQLDWVAALQKIGMILMSTVGGASGSLYGTLFVTMSKSARDRPLDQKTFAEAFSEGVGSVKLRGRADAGEKTMLDVLIPVADGLLAAAGASTPLPAVLDKISQLAVEGMESTRDMVAVKGRASFLGERSKGHIDPGAKTAQLIICEIAKVLAKESTAPS
ncbi:MAG: dihydroxyacetone kinase subunit DhaL [Gammaproteobacteria bacterium]